MKYIAALYTNDGKLVTGSHHGEAFGKLTVEEQVGELTSGFVDPKTGKFISDNLEFYVKKIILLRHANAQQVGEDPGLTKIGRLQGEQAANFLYSNIHDLSEHVGFCSPKQRCQQTGNIISKNVNLQFDVNDKFVDQLDSEDPKKFMIRLRSVLHLLPEKSVIISHCKFILNIAQLAIKSDDLGECNGLPSASVTLIDHHKLIWLGRDTSKGILS
jgi:phosphohistidine phosphatase SixA